MVHRITRAVLQHRSHHGHTCCHNNGLLRRYGWCFGRFLSRSPHGACLRCADENGGRYVDDSRFNYRAYGVSGSLDFGSFRCFVCHSPGAGGYCRGHRGKLDGDESTFFRSENSFCDDVIRCIRPDGGQCVSLGIRDGDRSVPVFPEMTRSFSDAGRQQTALPFIDKPFL